MNRAAVDLDQLSWPLWRLGEALETLGQRSGLATRPPGEEVIPEFFRHGHHGDNHEAAERWVGQLAARLGLEAEPIEAGYAEVPDLLRRCAPALLCLPGPSGPRLLLALAVRPGTLAVLDPALSTAEVDSEAVRTVLCGTLEARAGPGIDALLAGAAIDGQHRARARASLLGEFLARERISAGWLIRPAGTAPLPRQVREFRLRGLMSTLIAAHAIGFVLWLLSWWLLGQGILAGHLDPGWLQAWGLILLSLLPFRLLASYTGGLLSVRAGALLKRRLLFGASRLDPEEIRHQGAGQLLGRALEVETVEQMAVTGGFLGITGLIELALSSVVLGSGAGSGLHLLLLCVWIAISAGLGWNYLRCRRRWTEARLTLTHNLVEGMVGHRTRVAQEPRARWNDGEDQTLEGYYSLSRALDRAGLFLHVVVPRGWFIAGIVGLIPVFVAGAGSPTRMAIGIGGVLLAYQAFKYLAEGLERLLAAAVAWERIQPFWRAAARPERLGQPAYAGVQTVGSSNLDSPPEEGPRQGPLLDVHHLVFRHLDRPEAVLRDLSLQVYASDRILLEGPSGGGKSTLGMLLAGLRSPHAGLCLLAGLDRETLGTAGWRRQVVIVPQFHENHILMGTLAFNLLMGRAWPPQQRDLDEAKTVCHDLGLSPLLERMPAGLQQWVGETGWQLSHGERDRVYIARALLQGAEVVILDESLSALDPHTLRETLALVLKRVPVLIVIAHP